MLHNAQAQTNKIRFGLKIAPNTGWLRAQTANIAPSGSKLGFGYGLMAEKNILGSEKYALTAGIDVNNYGFKVKYDELIYDTLTTATFPNVLYKYNLQYLDLPVSLKFKTNEIGYFSYYGSFGIKPSFLLSSKAAVENAPITDEIIRTNDNTYDKYDFRQRIDGQTLAFKDDVWRFRTALIIGGGIEYSLNGGRNTLLAGIVWDQGFTGVLQDKQTKARNSYVALNIGFFF
jgi:hypothetical protein